MYWAELMQDEEWNYQNTVAALSGEFEEPDPLTLTRKDLFDLNDQELTELQRDLGQYLNTPREKEAVLLNRAINEEKQRRGPQYGF